MILDQIYRSLGIIFEEEKRAKEAYIKDLAGKVLSNEGDGLEDVTNFFYLQQTNKRKRYL